jgi:hypothetical protein
MIEFIIAFFWAVAALQVTADVGGKAVDYAEPTVTQGVEFVKDKLGVEKQE